jgi:hypothetical protein
MGGSCPEVLVPSTNVITQYFPQAAEHLQAAQVARQRLDAAWSALLDEEVFDTGIITNPDGSGVIVAYADWPTGSRDHLTALFRECVVQLWECLDALVTESVAMFSIRQRVLNPDASRYFPVADSPESFGTLLEQGCLDGALDRQVALIRACQPYRSSPSDPVLNKLRAGLRRLVEWENRLGDGSLIGAWATATDPRIFIEPPAEVVDAHPEPPGELVDERVVARYRATAITTEASVSGQAGTFIDLALPDGFEPGRPDDTFGVRLGLAIRAVGMFAGAFAKFVDETPGAKRLAGGTGDAAGSWTDARRSPRRWTDTELAAVGASELGLATVRNVGDLTLIVTTPHGTFERVIPDASPLPERVRRGTAAENAIHDAAATWGLPDFVLHPQQERKGRGVREIGDGLIVADERGVVVQAKSREGEPANLERESSWLTKNITAAVKQANGTVRQLSIKPSTMINGRGRTVTIDGNEIAWVAAIVIDHSDAPEDYQVPILDSKIPVIVLLRRDWEFLFNQLRSSRAVVDYLHRVGGPTETLGTEPQRYYELAAADRDAVDAPLDPVWAAWSGRRASVPLLPAAPAGSDDDEAHAMVRIMCEDIASSPLNGQTEESLLRVLAAIDRLPVGYRTDLGRLLLSALQTLRTKKLDQTGWQFRTFRPTAPGEVQLGFGVCSELSEITRAAFRSWFLLRHHERSAVEPLDGRMSVGVLLTPDRTGQRDWDTTMMAITGDPGLSPEELAVSRRLWNRES